MHTSSKKGEINMAEGSPIVFGGLASGMDTNAIIDKLVSIERQSITRLENQKKAGTTRKTLISDLITKLGTLSTELGKLNTSTAVKGRTFSLADTADFTATVSGGAPIGSYNINVTQLAQAQRT